MALGLRQHRLSEGSGAGLGQAHSDYAELQCANIALLYSPECRKWPLCGVLGCKFPAQSEFSATVVPRRMCSGSLPKGVASAYRPPGWNMGTGQAGEGTFYTCTLVHLYTTHSTHYTLRTLYTLHTQCTPPHTLHAYYALGTPCSAHPARHALCTPSAHRELDTPHTVHSANRTPPNTQCTCVT